MKFHRYRVLIYEKTNNTKITNKQTDNAFINQ